MKVKNVVKVMNFHALLRVNNARRKVSAAYRYERELKSVISSIINNRIFKQEHVSLEFPTDAKELNIYIGSDLGFCASFNSDIIRYLKNDDALNDKIVIGKKIRISQVECLLYMDKEEFHNDTTKIHDIILDGILSKKYSKVNIIYIHYYNLNEQVVVKRTLLPFDFEDEFKEVNDVKIDKKEDFVIEGDLLFILWSLITIYVSTEIKIADAWSWASENVKRQEFTDESLKKIEEKENEQLKIERKEKRQEEFKDLIENNNRKIKNKKKEV